MGNNDGMRTRREFTRALGLSVSVVSNALAATEKPNIVYVLADDLGWGDLSCYNPKSQVPMPNSVKLASEGMRFNDMHSPSAVCTPTRYGILTGRYCWRSRMKSGVLQGYSPNLIEPGRMTTASLLRDQGYDTGCVGKWHLGLGTEEKTDYSKPLHPCPNDHGFNYFFGIPASLDMAPYLFMRMIGRPSSQAMKHRGRTNRAVCSGAKAQLLQVSRWNRSCRRLPRRQ